MMTLFRPLRAGDLQLDNRIVMAALTRARAGRTHIPNDLMAEYYSQRASAGLLITEATMIARDQCAFTGEGGVFDAACVAGWRKVTAAVHARGGRIIVQLWHGGRAAHSLLNGGLQPVSSTDRAIRGGTIRTPEGPKPYEAPRRLRTDELPGIIEQFRAAARLAKEAGFDGAQIHGAHGYLLDQFLRDGVNDRTDEYGGALPNRARLLLETVDAVGQIFGTGRVAVRISPLVGLNDMDDSNPEELVKYIATELNPRRIAFLEIRHADHRAPAEQTLARIAREHFKGALFVNGAYDFESARLALEGGGADAVVFGRHFVSNPDLVERFSSGAELNAVDTGTLYTPGPAGYTDYPALNSEREPQRA
ncbi:MAG: nemA 1 [Gammaproteobacteria bacterium]|nr:nemA 1 [Gammaproteobacteria bacterium]